MCSSKTLIEYNQQNAAIFCGTRIIEFISCTQTNEVNNFRHAELEQINVSVSNHGATSFDARCELQLTKLHFSLESTSTISSFQIIVVGENAKIRNIAIKTEI